MTLNDGTNVAALDEQRRNTISDRVKLFLNNHTSGIFGVSEQSIYECVVLLWNASQLWSHTMQTTGRSVSETMMEKSRKYM